MDRRKLLQHLPFGNLKGKIFMLFSAGAVAAALGAVLYSAMPMLLLQQLLDAHAANGSALCTIGNII